MQKAEVQHNHAQNQPVVRQGKGASLESPQGEQIAQLEAMADSSPQSSAQRRMVDMILNSPYMSVQCKMAGAIHNSPHVTAQRQKLEAGAAAQREEATEKPNNTGLPDNLKSGIESLSGMSMDNVKVHYNSSQPAQLNALAYAQGTDIHVAPGQEQHLPHEAWHVVQQAQGRAQPTMQMKDGVPVNDDKSLEHGADVMGAKAFVVGGVGADVAQRVGGAGANTCLNFHASQMMDTRPLQRKRYVPDGANYVNKTDENVWLSQNSEQKGHLFAKDLGNKDDRGALMKAVADAAQPVGSDVTGKNWVNTAQNYDKPEVNKIDPFRLRISGTYDEDDKALATDYHFGPYNLGYVVKVSDRGSTATMAARLQLNDNTEGTTDTYSNRHHDRGNYKLLDDSENVGTTKTHSEQSFDSTTKMTGEGARFNCVKNHITNLADTTRFFTHTATHDRAAYWVPFSSLWLTWSATFDKDFGIEDCAVEEALKGDQLKKLGGISIPRGVGAVSSLTVGRDYNLHRSRAANENDKHKLIDLTITDTKEGNDGERTNGIKRALDDCDQVVYEPEMGEGGKSWSVTVWQDGGLEAVKGVMPGDTTVNVA